MGFPLFCIWPTEKPSGVSDVERKAGTSSSLHTFFSAPKLASFFFSFVCFPKGCTVFLLFAVTIALLVIVTYRKNATRGNIRTEKEKYGCFLVFSLFTFVFNRMSATTAGSRLPLAHALTGRAKGDRPSGVRLRLCFLVHLA